MLSCWFRPIGVGIGIGIGVEEKFDTDPDTDPDSEQTAKKNQKRAFLYAASHDLKNSPEIVFFNVEP